MDVRPARPTDAPLVLALAVDEEAQLVRDTNWAVSAPIARTLLGCLLPLPMPGRAWIARNGHDVALLEAQPRRYVIGWEITRLALRGDHREALEGVVSAAVDHLQHRGVPRLFACGQEDALDTLRSLDFKPIAREYLLTGSGRGADEPVPLPPGSRYRMPQDAWPLHQLAGSITPALVRQLEGSSSLDWSERPGRRTEIVIERDGQIVAWIGFQPRPRHRTYPLGMMVHPDHADVGPDLLLHVLGQVPAGSRCVARLREYQEGTVQLCLDAGFRITGRETLTVKHGLLAPATIGKRVRATRIPTIPVAPLTLCAGNAARAVSPRPQRKEVSR